MTELAKRYGGSLYDLAAEEQLTDQLLAELDVALDCFNQEPAYLRLLSTPGVPKKERCALLDKAFAEAHPYLVNFLKLLCEENLLAELPGCVRAYRDRYNADHGIIEATVVSAVPLNDTSREKLLAKLQEMTGKTVRLTAKVDPSILGGLRLDLNGTRLDGIGVIGAYTVGQNVRMIGNLVEHSDQFGDVIGYENHSGQTFLREGVQPLGTVNQDGRGNNGEDHTEGARVHNVIGTYMHGSLLPKNPAISDFLIETAVTRRYGTFDTSDQTPEQAKELARLDQVATNARKAAAERPR